MENFVFLGKRYLERWCHRNLSCNEAAFTKGGFPFEEGGSVAWEELGGLGTRGSKHSS